MLCTQGQVGLLCQLPFAGLQQEVIQILTQKARSEDVQLMIDGQSPNYYEILLAYHIFRSDYRSGMLGFDLARPGICPRCKLTPPLT